MKASEQPCPKDCPRRNSECHGTCPDYLTFQKKKFKEYETRAKAAMRRGRSPGKEALFRKAGRDKKDRWRSYK